MPFDAPESSPAPPPPPATPPVARPTRVADPPAPGPTPGAQAGRFAQPDLGVTLDYPLEWSAQPGENETTLTWLSSPDERIWAVLFYGPLATGTALEDAARQTRDSTTSGLSAVQILADGPRLLADGRQAWASAYQATREDGSLVRVQLTSAGRQGRLVSLMAFGAPEDLAAHADALDRMAASLALAAPLVHGIPRDEALVWLGGESDNPRHYDPATGGGDGLVFSGLVAFTPQLELAPDIAERWDVSADGRTYTFRLRPDARFHDGRPLSADDVIYSWERAADPQIDSDTVLTYLGDIVGVRERRAGQAERVSGLVAIDRHTLQVTIDAPKPYFPMKLTYSTAAVVDRHNIESGPEWYRAPNGAGPYKLVRWEPLKLQIYERNEEFYLAPPAIRYIVVELFAGVGTRMYETGAIDMAGVGLYDVERLRDPNEPLHGELHEGVSMCTSYIVFDVAQPPFDDPRVRQAFALAVDRQRYVDVVLRGVGLVARGPYPPALPGHSAALRGLDFDPQLARRRLAESRYGGAAALPPIVFTTSGFGSSVGGDVSALAQMWQDTLGVQIQIENLEPSRYGDELHDGNHGQLVSYGWCADYPDPENFADALFHSGAEQNLGGYHNPALDRLLEQARVERNVARRMALYGQAEQLIVDDAPAIFLNHSLNFVLVKPYVKGYVLAPIGVPIARYLSLDPAQME